MVRYTLSLSLATVLILSTTTAFGQNTEAQELTDDDDFFMEEVVVTSRKREETLQDVPFSVAARTEKSMREEGLVTLEDVSKTVASFSVQNLGPGQSQVAIRGASAGQIVRDQPGVKEQVGVYFDESPISLSLFTPDLDLFDLNRVEVLRGPQGTLFGSGSLSGTVRYITNQPDLEEASGAAEINFNTIDGGNSGGWGKAYINTPLGDNAALRVSAYYNDIAGWIDAWQPDGSKNNDVNDGSKWGARFAVRVETNDKLTVTPRLVYQKTKFNGWNREDDFNILANEFTTTRPQVDIGENEQYTQFEEPFTDEFLLTDLNIEYDFGEMVLTSITSYTNRDILVVRDATALTASITGGSVGDPEEVYTLDAPLDDWTDVSGWTQELRLGGGNDRLAWVGGLFYSDFTRHYGQELLVPGYDDLTGSNGSTEGSIIAPIDGLFWSNLLYDFRQWALFAEATWGITDAFDLTGGIRYYNYKEDRRQTFDGIFADPGTSFGDTKANGFAPRVIADWSITDDTKLLGQISKGFRLGGINDPLNIPLCTPEDLVTFGGNDEWGDEKLWNYEIGSKSTLMDGRATLNVAVFYQDIKDLQATVTAGSCSSRVISNVPKAHSTGIEFEFAAQQTANFDWAFSASYISAKLDSSVTSTDLEGNVSILGGLKDGNRLPTVPKFQAAIAATWTWDMDSGWEGYVNGIVQYVGSRYTQFGDQDPGFGSVDLYAFDPNNIGGPYTQDTFTFDPLLPSYTTANARIGFRQDRWDVSLYVNNLTNEDARFALDQERGTLARVGYLVGQPRTYGITARFGF